MKRVTLNIQMAQAMDRASQSHGLWRAVNDGIAKVIQDGIKNHRSRKQIATTLRAIAGKRVDGEPVALMNLRSAAKSIEAGEGLSYL